MTEPPAVAARLVPARFASHVVFAASGLLVASWASRIPQVSVQLRLTPAGLGAALLAQAAGGLVAAPLAGIVVARVGARVATAASGVVLGASLIGVAIGSAWSVAVTVVGLVVLGAGIGLGDVAMSTHATRLERETGLRLLPRSFGWFGIGGLAGALLGAVCTAFGVAPAFHLGVVGLVAGTAVVVGSRFYLADTRSTPSARAEHRAAAARTARFPRGRSALALGVIAATFAFAENTGNDWIGVALTRDRGQPALLAGVAFGCFVAAVTLGRFGLPALLGGFSASVVLRLSALTVAAGVIAFTLAPFPAAAVVAAVIWGAGCALGIPTALQLAGADPEDAAARIAVVTSCMYVAFLAAPAVIGLLGSMFPIPTALLTVVPLLVLAAALSGRRSHAAADQHPDTISTRGSGATTAAATGSGGVR